MRNKPTYKVLDLFGNEEIKFVEKDNPTPSLFTDYDGFLEKFEVKKTTDDCYTPDDVYDVVLNYVKQNCDIEGKRIVRPFYPGGDYERVGYTDNCVVIDNPPFSIITKICRFYIENKIKFFLFAPHLTNFSSDIDCTHIIAAANITYENGAVVKTSFLSNMFGDLKIIGDAELYAEFEKINKANMVKLPKYVYPDNIITVSKIAYCVEKGVSIKIDKSDVLHYRQMDSQKAHGKTLFGSGFICSDSAAKAQSKAQAKAQAKAQDNEDVIVWEISDKEKEIINMLNEN